ADSLALRRSKPTPTRLTTHAPSTSNCAETRLLSSLVANSRVSSGVNKPALVQTHTRYNAAATSHPISVDSCQGANHAAMNPAAPPATATNIARRRDETD